MSDDSAIYEALEILVSCSRMDQLAGHILQATQRLIPSDIIAYGEVDLVRYRATTFADSAPSCSMPLAGAWSELTLAEPVYSYWRQLQLQEAARFSDFVDQDQLREFEIYQRYYGPLGIKYQLVGPFAIADGVISSVGLSRTDRDFDEREKRLLNLLMGSMAKVHLRIAAMEKRAVAVSPRGELVFRNHFLLSPSGLLMSATPQGLEWLGIYCGRAEIRSGQLPPRLRAWVVDALARPDELPATRYWGGSIVRPAAQTTLVNAPEKGGAVLELVRREPLELEELQQLLGVTPRQAEAAWGLLHTLSNAKIARRMGVSPATVRTHLLGLYDALGVSGDRRTGRTTRAAAFTEILARIEAYVLRHRLSELDA